MLFAKFAGLLTILIRPTILKILQLTNQSSTPLTAYKRYMATIFHMTIWYDEDFKPGSKLVQSGQVRCVCKKNNPINCKENEQEKS